MAVLSDVDRIDIWADWMRRNSDPVSILKADLRAAVDAIDAWVDANAAAFNAAIPQPARSALTAHQKARIRALVIQRHFERS